MSEYQLRDIGNFMIFGGILILLAAVANIVFMDLAHVPGTPLNYAEVGSIIRSMFGVVIFVMFICAGIRVKR